MRNIPIENLTLQSIDERIDQLPLLPAVVSQLMKIHQDTTHFYEQATELAKNDPPLATRVLRIANSASAAASKPIINMREALIRVGVDRALSLITAVSVARVFTPSKPEHKAIWQHSIETAQIAYCVAEHFKALNVDKDLAYTCGLLHDIGRFVLFENAAKALEATDAKGWDSPIELPVVEKELLGFTHADVGYLAAKKWHLPKTIENVIHYHHRYDLWRLDKGSVTFRSLLTVVQFADFLSVLIEKKPDWSEWSEEFLREEIKHVCIHKHWPAMEFPLDEVIAELPAINDKCQSMMSNLGID